MRTRLGMYVMISGTLKFQPDGKLLVLVTKYVNISDEPNRETLWYLEVIDVHNKYYNKFT